MASEWSLEEIALLKRLATEGFGLDAICTQLMRPASAIDALAQLLGLPLDKLDRGQWCDRCSSFRSELDPVTGWCLTCTERRKLELQREADAAEEDRLRKDAMKDDAVVRKARQRMREEYGVNPRKGKAAE